MNIRSKVSVAVGVVERHFFVSMVKNQQEKKPERMKKMLIQFLVSLGSLLYSARGAEHDFSEWSEQRKKHSREEKRNEAEREIIHRHAQNVVLR